MSSGAATGRTTPMPRSQRSPGLRTGCRPSGAPQSVFGGDAQDFEFTVEDGALWLLQTRAAKRTAWAVALRIACDLVDDGVIDPQTALARLQAYDIRRDLPVATRVGSGGRSR